MTRDAVGTLDRVYTEGVALNTFVEAIVIVVVCPLSKVLVTEISRLEVRNDTKLNEVAEDLAFDGRAGALLNMVCSPDKVAVDMTELLSVGGKLEPIKDFAGG